MMKKKWQDEIYVGGCRAIYEGGSRLQEIKLCKKFLPKDTINKIVIIFLHTRKRFRKTKEKFIVELGMSI